MGAFLKPSSPTFSTYFLGTTHAAPVALVPLKVIGTSCAAWSRGAGAARKTMATWSAVLQHVERPVLVMPHLAPAIATPSTAGPGVVGQHLGHARRHLHPRRQVDELVRAVGVR